jgi:hypothetical protein
MSRALRMKVSSWSPMVSTAPFGLNVISVVFVPSYQRMCPVLEDNSGQTILAHGDYLLNSTRVEQHVVGYVPNIKTWHLRLNRLVD